MLRGMARCFFPSALAALALGLVAGRSQCTAAEFPTPHNSGAAEHRTPPALTPEAATAALRLPAGFRATLFASEPEVQNPVAMAWDGRGRLWIAENYTYAERGVRFDTRLRDRVVVFEEGGPGGRFATRRVFLDDVAHLGSVTIGHGGVWLLCPPQLLFVPDHDGDAVPDGPREVVLDGFTRAEQNHHTFANGLEFGPDGWLYGRCGAGSPGELGVPGTPPEARIPLRGTLWRYHPTRKVVEVLSSGATNPWGHDWDEHGELFFINTVNGHLWHGIVGAHLKRPHTIDPNPRVYELMEQHADHWHFDTKRTWQDSRDGAANALGGGHAHVGMMIYQGTNWPAEYRGGLFTLNFHGRRANHEKLERSGSGYVGRHAPDLFVSSDPWFRGIEIDYGPDGGVFVLDWSDTGECHNSTGVNRTSGRIYKIVQGDPRRDGPLDLAEARGRDLAGWQAHPNEWLVRQARLELVRRAGEGHKLTHGIEDLRAMLATHPDVRVKLRALWTLHSLGAADRALLESLLGYESEHLRVWAVRLLTDDWPLDTVMSSRPSRPERAEPVLVRRLAEMARTDSSGLVRLALASTLQRLPAEDRIELATALVERAEDASDHNLPLLVWYGLIPVADSAPDKLAQLALQCTWPTTRRLIARRLAEDIEQRPAALTALLEGAAEKPAAFRADLLEGMTQALRGWRRATKPAGWDAFAAGASAHTPEAQARVRDLNLLFGEGRALAEVKALALDPRADLAARQAALGALIEARPPDLREVCERLLRVRFLSPAAARGLALFDGEDVAELIATAHGTFFHPSERGVAIDVLATRVAFARVLLSYIEAGKIPRAALTPFHVRQIRSLGDPALSRQLTTVWGESREAMADVSAKIAAFKAELTPAVLAAADLGAGRALFAQLCGACHTLNGEGGSLGPDLTGAQRDNLDYLLENIVAPGAVVSADYRMTIVRMKDGRTLNGFIPARTERTLTVRGMAETITVERADIERIEESAESLMPAGLIDALTGEQRRDLIAYLSRMHKQS